MEPRAPRIGDIVLFCPGGNKPEKPLVAIVLGVYEDEPLLADIRLFDPKDRYRQGPDDEMYLDRVEGADGPGVAGRWYFREE